jgi:hypothetical protein
MVATSNTYTESKIQGHLSYQFCFLYKYSSYDYKVIFFMSKCVYIILGHFVYMEHLFLMFPDHTQRRTTIGRTPLNE